MDILAILNRIEILLKESGHSKSELYSACSVSASAISQWKSGKTSPATKSLQSIADYLNVSYEYLVSGVGQKEKIPTTVSGDGLDSEELALFNMFRALSSENRTKLIELARLYVEDQQRRKTDS